MTTISFTVANSVGQYGRCEIMKDNIYKMILKRYKSETLIPYTNRQATYKLSPEVLKSAYSGVIQLY